MASDGTTYKTEVIGIGVALGLVLITIITLVIIWCIAKVK